MSKAKAQQVFRVALRGDALLHSPRWNKGSAFTAPERAAFALTGRLPAQLNSLDEQCERAYAQLESHPSAISKNSFLQSMRAQVRRSRAGYVAGFNGCAELDVVLHPDRPAPGGAHAHHLHTYRSSSN
jgi:hypothetical protein